MPCRLYIKQPSSNTSISGDDDDTEWAEYKIKETNMFTVDKYQQVRFSSNAGKLKCKQYIYIYFLVLSLWFQCFFKISITISLQIGFFPSEKAFALRYQTAGMLETVLRQGVLGEDDTGEESPRQVLRS